MITLTRFNGDTFAVAANLIERVEAHPDTTVHLTNGHTHLVAEPIDVVIGKVRAWHAGIRADAHRLVDEQRRTAAVDPAVDVDPPVAADTDSPSDDGR